MSGDLPANVADTVRAAAQRSPARPALLGPEPGAAVTWGELDRRVDAVAAGLTGLRLPASLGAPARVAIALPQSVAFAEVFFGVLRAGLVAVPVNPAFTARELRHVLADSGARVLVASAAVVATLRERGDGTAQEALPELAHIYATEPVAGARPLPELASPAAPAPTAGGGTDLAALLYTSGTSGAPKGAMLPHRALLANQRQVAAVRPAPVGPDDVVLLALPLFHVFGLNAGLGAVAYHGATGVLLDRFEPAAALRTIAEHRVSVVGAVPQMYAAWLAVPQLATAFGSVRVAVSGAAALPDEVATRFAAVTGRNIRQGYGLTETAPVLTMGPGEGTPKPTAIGRPVPGVQVRLVAGDGSVIADLTADGSRAVAAAPAVDFVDDDAFDEAGTDPGEIVVRGENLFLGYWPDGAGGPDTDGWWHTGDIAYADADGDLHLVDRLGELVIVNGFNVYPQEVEQVLLSHPEVAEVAVIGVPDPVTGEAVHAFVVPAAGAALTIDGLRTHCERNLARYKCPVSYQVVAQLPRSATGKVRKARLRASA